jgi:hypothetical protein
VSGISQTAVDLENLALLTEQKGALSVWEAGGVNDECRARDQI